MSRHHAIAQQAADTQPKPSIKQRLVEWFNPGTVALVGAGADPGSEWAIVQQAVANPPEQAVTPETSAPSKDWYPAPGATYPELLAQHLVSLPPDERATQVEAIVQALETATATQQGTPSTQPVQQVPTQPVQPAQPQAPQQVSQPAPANATAAPQAPQPAPQQAPAPVPNAVAQGGVVTIPAESPPPPQDPEAVRALFRNGHLMRGQPGTDILPPRTAPAVAQEVPPGPPRGTEIPEVGSYPQFAAHPQTQADLAPGVAATNSPEPQGAAPVDSFAERPAIGQSSDLTAIVQAAVASAMAPYLEALATGKPLPQGQPSSQQVGGDPSGPAAIQQKRNVWNGTHMDNHFKTLAAQLRTYK